MDEKYKASLIAALEHVLKTLRSGRIDLSREMLENLLKSVQRHETKEKK